MGGRLEVLQLISFEDEISVLEVIIVQALLAEFALSLIRRAGVNSLTQLGSNLVFAVLSTWVDHVRLLEELLNIVKGDEAELVVL